MTIINDNIVQRHRADSMYRYADSISRAQKDREIEALIEKYESIFNAIKCNAGKGMFNVEVAVARVDYDQLKWLTENVLGYKFDCNGKCKAAFELSSETGMKNTVAICKISWARNGSSLSQNPSLLPICSMVEMLNRFLLDTSMNSALTFCERG